MCSWLNVSCILKAWWQVGSSQVKKFITCLTCFQGLMNSLYSQPFAHYNTQPPLNLQAPQQQPQQGQSSQNQKIHFNGWERKLFLWWVIVLAFSNLVLCSHVCPSISAALECRRVFLLWGSVWLSPQPVVDYFGGWE